MEISIAKQYRSNKKIKKMQSVRTHNKTYKEPPRGIKEPSPNLLLERKQLSFGIEGMEGDLMESSQTIMMIQTLMLSFMMVAGLKILLVKIELKVQHSRI